MGEFTIKKDTKGYNAYLDLTGDYMFTTDNDAKMDKITRTLEKQIPKKPIEVLVEECGIEVEYSNCPNCITYMGLQRKYCHNCGQKLDWSDLNERD